MAGWNIEEQNGIPTSDTWIKLFPIPDVIAETEALLNGSSHVTIDRVRRMERSTGSSRSDPDFQHGAV